MKIGVHFSSDSNEWETPQWLFDKLNAEFNFTLDVCATKFNSKVKNNFYDIKNNALLKYWEGTWWMNPPYGREIKNWIKHGLSCVKTVKSTGVCLIPARTDTIYWHSFITKAAEIRFLKGRLKFSNCDTPAPFPSAIIVFKPVFESLKISHVNYIAS